MGEPLAPLSPSYVNRETPMSLRTQREHLSTIKSKQLIADENHMPGSPIGIPSSPLVEDVGLPPSKFFKSPSKNRSPEKERTENIRPLTEDALRAKNMDDSNIDPAIRSPPREDDTMSTMAGANGYNGMDDTCFSAFSAVPNADMTRFANLGLSPAKNLNSSPSKRAAAEDSPTRSRGRHTPSKQGHQPEDPASPTPRNRRMRRDDDTLNLMDFDDEINSRHGERSPHKLARHSPYKTGPHHDLSSFAANRRTPSPAKHPLPPTTPNEAQQLANLLDFDLTPAPTPRSIPSITARELESMKSNFLSQISSLTATLSGREAEVKALSNAVTDAERRVGEALEEIRNEKNAKEALQSEKDGLEARQREMQKVLKDVKEEIMASDREKDALLQRSQEAEHQREVAEAKTVEAESKLEGMCSRQNNSGDTAPENGANVNAEVEAAVTKVAKELHGLYKSKHEAKVTALKKSYSDRWEKKIKELQSKVDELSKENEDLRIGRDATMSGVVPGMLPAGKDTLDLKSDLVAQQQRNEEQKAKIEAIEREFAQASETLKVARDENRSLQVQLSASRSEIEELISATEEMMQLSNASALGDAETQTAATSGTTSQEIKTSLNRSLSGSSGLKAPGFGGGTYGSDSRIGRFGAAHTVTNARDRSGSALGSRSGIMSNIERMGRGRVVD